MKAALLLVVLVGCEAEPPMTTSSLTCHTDGVYLTAGTTKDLGPFTIDGGGTMLCLVVNNFDNPAAHLMVTTDAEPGTQSSFSSELLDPNHDMQLLVDGSDVTVGNAMPQTSNTLEWDVPAHWGAGVRYVIVAPHEAATTAVHASLVVPLEN